jgi:molecular chaperone DnaK (HSP70)
VAKAVGIDLGTTNSAIAVWEGVARLLPEHASPHHSRFLRVSVGVVRCAVPSSWPARARR